MDNSLSQEEHTRYQEVEKSTSRQLLIVFGVRLLFLTSCTFIINYFLDDYHPGLLIRILLILAFLFLLGGFITNLIDYFRLGRSETFIHVEEGQWNQTRTSTKGEADPGVIYKILNHISHQIREIRQEKLEGFLHSANPKAQRVARHQLNHPGVYDIYSGFLRLIIRLIRQFLGFLLSPLTNFIKKEQYSLILEKLSSGDNLTKLSVIPKLAEYPGDSTIEVLNSLLDDNTDDIRLLAVETLRDLNDERILLPLKVAYEKESQCFNRIMISLSLISQGDTSTFDYLFDDIAENAIDNDHWDMTDLVYMHLINELKENGIPYLEKGLKHPDYYVRWISLRVIYELAQNKLEILERYIFLNEDPYLELRKLYRELLH